MITLLRADNSLLSSQILHVSISSQLTMVPPTGIIITVSVLVAAGIAAYENPHVREWIENSRRKIAIALHSLGDDIHPEPKHSRKDDASMQEDQSDEAAEKRRQARAEILERGRVLEEKRRRSLAAKKPSQSFDTLVDRDGVLLAEPKGSPKASTTAIDHPAADNLTHRHHPDTSDRTPPPNHPPPDLLIQLENSMREEFSRSPTLSTGSTHASESLINLTPTSEFPDPDISLPSSSLQHTPSSSRPVSRTEYFSATASSPTQHEPDYYYAHPSDPFSDINATTARQNMLQVEPPSSAPSTIGSEMEHINAHLAESEDDLLSEEGMGDGIRTPGSAWTEVGSEVSGEGGQGRA